MSTRARHWSGTDLSPLPFESTVGSLWRFGWRNVLNAMQLRNICSDASTYPTKNFFDAPRYINSDRFFAETKWILPSAEEAEFICENYADPCIWVERNFRYCPLCLEHGYHSFWFQFIPLSCCPIHQVELSIRCHSCGARLSDYRLSKELFNKPYYCVKCNSPICGVPPSFSAHNEFRIRETELVDAFRPFSGWLRATREARSQAYRLSQGVNFFRQEGWCRPGELMRSLVCTGEHLPRYFMAPIYPRVTVLSWSMMIYHDPNYVNMPVRRAWDERVKIPMAVYRSTLRLLEEWVAENEEFSEVEYRRHASFEIHAKGINVRTYYPGLLALCLMRWQLETGCRFYISQKSRTAQLKDEPVVRSMYTYQRRTPRLAWRALFLGIFASWYYRTLAAKRSGIMDISGPIGADDSLVFSSIRCERTTQGEDKVSGEVAFPAIEGISSLFRRMRTPEPKANH